MVVVIRPGRTGTASETTAETESRTTLQVSVRGKAPHEETVGGIPETEEETGTVTGAMGAANTGAKAMLKGMI